MTIEANESPPVPVGPAVSIAKRLPESVVERSRVTGDAYDRFIRTADGTVYRGNGTAEPLAEGASGLGAVGAIERSGAVVTGSYESLDTWRASLARVRAGTDNARVIVVGDSTIGGTPTSFVDRMCDLWAANRLKESRRGLIWPTDNALHVDPRVVYGAGQSNIGAGNFGLALAGAGYISPGAGGTLDVGAVYCDTWEIFYFDLGVGSFDVWSDGGAHTTVNTVGAGWFNSVVIAAGAAGNHTLHIGDAVGVSTMILAVEGRVGAAGLYVSQAGVGGSHSTMWNDISGGGGSPRVMIGAMTNPDLTVIMLTTGDANFQQSIATYTTNIDALVVQQQGQGSVVLAVAPRPRLPDAYPIQYDEYIAALEGIRDNRGVAMINFANHFAGLEHDDFMEDDLHPTVAAQGEMALVAAAALMP